jgi:hypothetical protein
MAIAVEKAITEAAQELGSEFSTGLDLLVAVYRNSRFPLELRMNAAAQAARYQVPSLSASLTATVGNSSATAPLGVVMLPVKDADDDNGK